jgi:hypothetical protein
LYPETAPCRMIVTNPDGAKSLIRQEKVTESKKTLGIHNSPSRGNASHLSYIKEKVGVWC